jgi:plastocyanin
MAQTSVNIDSNQMANPNAVPVAEGDIVTITASGGPVTLYFSPDCLKLLSPAPSATATVSNGETLTFTFTTSNPGNYMVDISLDAGQHPHFLPMSSRTLNFTTLLHRVRVGPSSTTQGNF